MRNLMYVWRENIINVSKLFTLPVMSTMWEKTSWNTHTNLVNPHLAKMLYNAKNKWRTEAATSFHGVLSACQHLA